jgi:hypothetical protein
VHPITSPSRTKLNTRVYSDSQYKDTPLRFPSLTRRSDQDSGVGAPNARDALVKPWSPYLNNVICSTSGLIELLQNSGTVVFAIDPEHGQRLSQYIRYGLPSVTAYIFGFMVSGCPKSLKTNIGEDASTVSIQHY